MALLFTVLLGMSVGILGYFNYYFTRGHYVHGAQAILDTERDFIVHMADLGQAPERLDRMIDRRGIDNQRLFLLSGPGGEKLAGNLDTLPDHVGRLSEGIVTFTFPCVDKTCYYAAQMHTFSDGRKLFIAADITQAADQFSRMKLLSVLSILFMALVVLTSFVISTFVVSRINMIAETARGIMETGDLSQRISIESRWDDLSNLAYVLNGLLERIEVLMQGVRRVSDSIAHDLRTPLTRMRNRLEDVLQQPRIAKDKPTRTDIERLLGEADNLLSVFNGLLRITNIETRKQRYNFAALHLRDLLQDVIELYDPVAQEAGVALKGELADVTLRGDRDMLFQAVANVLDNAIKFTPKGGEITLSLGAERGRAVIRVTDTGPGVPEDEREKVFSRFYRADTSRSTPGSGLGLSLVKAVVELHGGEVVITHADGQTDGAAVVMQLPQEEGNVT